MTTNLLSIFNNFNQSGTDSEIEAYSIFEQLLECLRPSANQLLGNIHYMYAAFLIEDTYSRASTKGFKTGSWVSEILTLCKKRYFVEQNLKDKFILSPSWKENYLEKIQDLSIKETEHLRRSILEYYKLISSYLDGINENSVTQILGIEFDYSVIPQIRDSNTIITETTYWIYHQEFSSTLGLQIDFFYRQSSVYLGLYHGIDPTYDSLESLENTIHVNTTIFGCSRPQFLQRFFDQAKRKHLIEIEDSDIHQLILLLVGPNLPAASKEQSQFWSLAHPYIPEFRVTKMFCTELCRVLKRMINQGYFYSNYRPHAISSLLRKASLPNLILEEIDKHSKHQLNKEDIEELRFKINKEITVKLEPILNKVIQGTDVNKSSIATLLNRLFPEISKRRYQNILKGRDDPQFKSVSRTFIFGHDPK